jgi:hypothetical protein
MEQDILKSIWQGADAVAKPENEIRSMLQERKHPVLKRIRKQLIIETIAFALLLFVYYDIFDGDQKSFYANAFLVIALILLIVHNIVVYFIVRNPFKGGDVKQSLNNRLQKIKFHAKVSVVNRILVNSSLLLFFTSFIVITTIKGWILVLLAFFFIVQLLLLYRIWMKRIRQLKNTIEQF